MSPPIGTALSLLVSSAAGLLRVAQQGDCKLPARSSPGGALPCLATAEVAAEARNTILAQCHALLSVCDPGEQQQRMSARAIRAA